MGSITDHCAGKEPAQHPYLLKNTIGLETVAEIDLAAAFYYLCFRVP